MYLLDSSIIIEFLRNTPRCEKIIKLIDDKSVVITSLTAHELLLGATEKELFIVEGLLNGFEVLSYDVSCATISSRIEKELFKKGEMINLTDIFIASIALKNDFTLVTLDNDFRKISNLKTKIL